MSGVVRTKEGPTDDACGAGPSPGNVQLGNMNRKRPQADRPDCAIDHDSDSNAVSAGAASAGAPPCRARRQQHAMLQVGDVGNTLARSQWCSPSTGLIAVVASITELGAQVTGA